LRAVNIPPEFSRDALGAEQPPLDFLKSGDRVLFRVEIHRKIGGKEIDVYIPYADNPSKEVKFLGEFVPLVPQSVLPPKPTDNVKAMCDSHQLPPELEKTYCSQ
jgi:hypothetical protein